MSSTFCSPGVNGTHWECLVNRLFVSMASQLLIGSALSIVYLSPLCHGYSLECLVNYLFISMMLLVLIGGVFCGFVIVVFPDHTHLLFLSIVVLSLRC